MRYVALLRALNVGGHAVISMEDLRTVAAGLGHTDVSTYLQSGNLLFTTSGRRSTSAIAKELESALRQSHGIDVRCLLRTRDDLQRVVDANPLGDVATTPARYLVVFMEREPDPRQIRAIDPEAFAPDRFAIVGREVFTWCPEGVGKTKLTQGFFEKRLGAGVGTGRNWNTVTKLLALL